MNKLWSLTKIQLKDFLSKYQSGLNLGGKHVTRILTALLIIALLTIPIQMVTSLYNSFLSFGIPELTITYLYITAIFIMFFSAIPLLVSLLFYGGDIKFLASLPVSEETIILSKLSVIYVYLFGISGILFAPGLVVYGFMEGIDPSYVIGALVALVLSPILPLFITTIMIMPFIKLISKSNTRNLFAVIGGFLLVFLIFAFQIFIIRQQSDPAYVLKMLMEEGGILSLFGMRFPPSIWLTRMVLGSIKDGIYFVILNVLLFIPLSIMSRTLYNKAVQEFNQEGASIKGKIYYKKQSKSTQMIKRHVLIILKQPAFLLNTALTLLLPVIMLIVTMFTGEFSMEVLNLPEIKPLIPLIFAVTISLPAVMANLSATVITREGKTFWETKVFPISAKENIKYRVASTILINLFGSLLLFILGLIILPLTYMNVAIAILFCIALTFFLATADIIINVYRPLLDWIHPTAAVKNNLNILISLVFRGVIGLPLYGLYRLLDFPYETLLIIFAEIFIVLYLISRFYVYKKLPDKFTNITI